MIIVPDVHGRDFWMNPVNQNLGKEHILFLGDYLDPYYYENIPQEVVFPRFLEIIALKKEYPESVTLLLGNHDLHYLDRNLEGSRYDYANQYRNRKTISDNTECFQMTYETEVAGRRYLFSHAGVLNGWIMLNKPLLAGARPEEIGERLNKYWRNRGYWPRLFRVLSDVPYSRGGYAPWGSPVWSDVDDFDKDDYELPDNYQIFGHSQQVKGPIITDYFACLDCRRVFRLTDTGELQTL